MQKLPKESYCYLYYKLCAYIEYYKALDKLVIDLYLGIIREDVRVFFFFFLFFDFITNRNKEQ